MLSRLRVFLSLFTFVCLAFVSVRLPAADMVELQTRLKPIGADITKSDPNLKAFYEKVLATAAKY